MYLGLGGKVHEMVPGLAGKPGFNKVAEELLLTLEFILEATTAELPPPWIPFTLPGIAIYMLPFVARPSVAWTASKARRPCPLPCWVCLRWSRSSPISH